MFKVEAGTEKQVSAHLHRRVSLTGGGEHLGRASSDAWLSALQQPQQRGQAPNHRQVCTAFKATTTQMLPLTRQPCNRGRG